MPPNVRFFAGFASSLAFRYSVIFIVRLKKFQSTPCRRSCNAPFGIVDVERARSSTTYFEEIGHKNSRHKDPMNPSERIDELIAKLTDWRGKTFASIRKSILEADREIIEEWKWMGSPVWS